MKFVCVWSALAGLILALAGCAELGAPSPGNGLFMAKLQDCKPGFIPTCDNFGPGEIPAVVFVNYNELTITIRVTSQTTAGIVWNKTDYIPRDQTTGWWALKKLPSGAYKAELFLGGTLRQSFKFNVNK
jgi:hypothetical protein